MEGAEGKFDFPVPLLEGGHVTAEAGTGLCIRLRLMAKTIMWLGFLIKQNWKRWALIRVFL